MSIFEISMLAGTFLLFAFAMHLFVYPKGNFLLNKLLGIIFLSRGFQHLFFLFISLIDQSAIISLFSLISTIMFIVAPALYLYIRSFINDQSKLNYKDALHLIPAAIGFINVIPFLMSSASIKDDVFFQTISTNNLFPHHWIFLIPIRIQFLLRSIILLIYLGFSWKMVKRFSAEKSQQIYSTDRFHLELLLAITTFQAIFSFISAFNLILQDQSLISMVRNSWLMMVPSVLIYLFIIWILRNPIILYGNLIIPQNNKNNPEPIREPNKILQPVEGSSTEPRFLLSEKQIDSQLKQMNHFMAAEKPYLDPDFNLQSLSASMKKPVHHCSYILNQIIRKSFREYLNSYRIQHFITLYVQKSDKFTLEYQANEVGFRNRSTFNIAFKKETGYTPTEYFNLSLSNSILIS